MNIQTKLTLVLTVCFHQCTHVCLQGCADARANECAYVYACADAYVCVCVCRRWCMFACMCECMHKCFCMYASMHICTHGFVSIRMLQHLCCKQLALGGAWSSIRVILHGYIHIHLNTCSWVLCSELLSDRPYKDINQRGNQWKSACLQPANRV